MSDKIQLNNFINIQGWMVKDLYLKNNELLIYAIIYGFSQDGSSCFSGSSSYLAEWCSCSKQTVFDTLKKLVEKELIIRKEKIINGVKLVDYYINTKILEDIKNFDRGSQKTLQGVVKNFDRGSQKTLYHNIEDNKDTYNIDINKEIYKESKLSFDCTYFQNEFNNLVEGTNIPKIAILSDKRIKAINKILNNKQYSVNGEVMFKNEKDILNFIKEEVITSDFLCGKNTSWRADIDFILKPTSLIKIIEGNYRNTKFNNNQSYKQNNDKYIDPLKNIDKIDWNKQQEYIDNLPYNEF